MLSPRNCELRIANVEPRSLLSNSDLALHLPRAVFLEATVIATSWYVSSSSRPSSRTLCASNSATQSCARCRSISSQKPDSSASSSTVPSFEMKSDFNFARHAERYLAAVELEERITCPTTWRVSRVCGSLEHSLITSSANVFVRHFSSSLISRTS
jgi:hypothetical protein